MPPSVTYRCRHAACAVWRAEESRLPGPLRCPAGAPDPAGHWYGIAVRRRRYSWSTKATCKQCSQRQCDHPLQGTRSKASTCTMWQGEGHGVVLPAGVHNTVCNEYKCALLRVLRRRDLKAVVTVRPRHAPGSVCVGPGAPGRRRNAPRTAALAGVLIHVAAANAQAGSRAGARELGWFVRGASCSLIGGEAREATSRWQAWPS